MASVPSLLVYPPKLNDLESNPAHIQFQFFERNSTRDSSPKTTVALYMPQQVSQPSTVDWSQGRLGFVGNAAVEMLQSSTKGFNSGTDFWGSVGGATSGALGSIASQFGEGSQLAAFRAGGSALQALVSLGGGSATAEQIIGAGLGQAFNPYLTMLFNGVSFRTFTFTFKFVPFYPEDCDRIHDIIKTFRKYSLPEGSAAEAGLYDGAAEAGPMLKYPGECQIKYLWRGSGNKYLHKFTRAVCTGVNIDYTGQGMFAVMRNGMPANITMTTSWSEINLVLADDVDKKGY